MILDNIYAVIGAEVYFVSAGWIGQGEIVGMYRIPSSIIVEIVREEDKTRYSIDASLVFDTLEQVASHMACIDQARMFTGNNNRIYIEPLLGLLTGVVRVGE